jgi:hypothetical protein
LIWVLLVAQASKQGNGGWAYVQGGAEADCARGVALES